MRLEVDYTGLLIYKHLRTTDIYTEQKKVRSYHGSYEVYVRVFRYVVLAALSPLHHLGLCRAPLPYL